MTPPNEQTPPALDTAAMRQRSKTWRVNGAVLQADAIDALLSALDAERRARAEAEAQRDAERVNVTNLMSRNPDAAQSAMHFIASAFAAKDYAAIGKKIDEFWYGKPAARNGESDGDE